MSKAPRFNPIVAAIFIYLFSAAYALTLNLPPLAAHESIATPNGLFIVGGYNQAALNANANGNGNAPKPVGYFVRYDAFGTENAEAILAGNGDSVYDTACAYDQAAGQVLCVGGRLIPVEGSNSGHSTNKTLVFSVQPSSSSSNGSPALLHELSASPYNPSTTGHRAVYINGQFYVFGGEYQTNDNSTRVSSDLAVVSLQGDVKEAVLQPVITQDGGSDPAPARALHCLVPYDDTSFIALLGASGDVGPNGPVVSHNDIYLFNTKSKLWRRLATSSDSQIPPLHSAACTISTASSSSKTIYVFGGVAAAPSSSSSTNSSQLTNAIWRLSLDPLADAATKSSNTLLKWENVSPHNPAGSVSDALVPVPRRRASVNVVGDGSLLVVFGGYLSEKADVSVVETQSTFYYFDLCTSKWIPKPSSLTSAQSCRPAQAATPATTLAIVVTMIALIGAFVSAYFLINRKRLRRRVYGLGWQDTSTATASWWSADEKSGGKSPNATMVANSSSVTVSIAPPQPTPSIKSKRSSKRASQPLPPALSIGPGLTVPKASYTTKGPSLAPRSPRLGPLSATNLLEAGMNKFFLGPPSAIVGGGNSGGLPRVVMSEGVGNMPMTPIATTHGTGLPTVGPLMSIVSATAAAAVLADSASRADAVDAYAAHREQMYAFAYDLLRVVQSSGRIERLPGQSVFATFFKDSAASLTATTAKAGTASDGGLAGSEHADRFAIHHILSRSIHDSLFKPLGNHSLLTAYVSFLAARKELHAHLDPVTTAANGNSSDGSIPPPTPSVGADTISDQEVLKKMRDHLACHLGIYMSHTNNNNSNNNNSSVASSILQHNPFSSTAANERMVRDNPLAEYVQAAKASVRSALSVVIPTRYWIAGATASTSTSSNNTSGDAATQDNADSDLESHLNSLVWSAVLTFLQVKAFDPACVLLFPKRRSMFEAEVMEVEGGSGNGEEGANGKRRKIVAASGDAVVSKGVVLVKAPVWVEG
ncbi:hypothetical protein HK102_006255 [Quaeritorhiza haematococci]|nr:hypothetical protein HK102_006255 [Quaeritorhiza haematococci]